MPASPGTRGAVAVHARQVRRSGLAAGCRSRQVGCDPQNVKRLQKCEWDGARNSLLLVHVGVTSDHGWAGGRGAGGSCGYRKAPEAGTETAVLFMHSGFA
jgi:hypothetical protein